MDKPHGVITVGCSGDEERWTFSVADNGPGIDEKYHDRIFQLFQTLSHRDDYESTGIGLTLVKKIVELYRGRVWVESRLGEGSTFFFTLPKTQGETHHERLQTCAAG
jgi:signal transduction histidine kinase